MIGWPFCTPPATGRSRWERTSGIRLPKCGKVSPASACPSASPSSRLLILALAGCVNFAEQPDMPAVVYFVLEDPAPATPVKQAAADVPTLVVLDTTAGGFYDTDQVIFSRSPGTRGCG